MEFLFSVSCLLNRFRLFLAQMPKQWFGVPLHPIRRYIMSSCLSSDGAEFDHFVKVMTIRIFHCKGIFCLYDN